MVHALAWQLALRVGIVVRQQNSKIVMAPLGERFLGRRERGASGGEL